MSVTVQGVEVFVRESGRGEPVLFLHGNPDSADLWQDVIARLQNRYRCIAIDLPGFGRSKAPRAFDVSIENLGRFIDGVVESVGVNGPINLVAHDFGGAFAIAFASAHPNKVRRLVAINYPFFVGNYKWHSWARIWRTPLVGELSMVTLTWPAFRWLLKQASKKLTDEQIRRTYSLVTSESKRIMLRLYRAIGPEEFRKWEPRMLEATAKVPTLVLWGQHDPYVPEWVADKFGARRVARFEESGHWPPAEVPELVSAELVNFFQS